MDDTKALLSPILRSIALGLGRLTVILGLIVAGRLARAEVNYTYISPEQVKELASQFDAAAAGEVATVTAHQWTCDMYGVASKLQVHRDLKLYAFEKVQAKATDVAASFVNTGDEPIRNYLIKNNSLEGRGSKDTLDQVRVTKDGRLISKLSVPSRGITVAYALCTGS